MLKSTELIMDKKLHHHIIRDGDLAHLFGGTAARRYGLVNKALEKGELIRLCRGYYTLSSKYMTHPLSTAYIANRLVPNSFVSAESALSFHGWIPERVAQTVSICGLGRNRSFQTPLGDFIYYKTPVEPSKFFRGVELKQSLVHTLYMASPLRALMDYIYLHKVDNADSNFLVDSLRIDNENLARIKTEEIKVSMSVYKALRVKRFLQNLLEEGGYE
jgi:hypothetical protein